MARARAAIAVPGRVSDAEALWYDTRRWAGFVDGFSAISKVEGDWPRVGSRVVWTSTHDGRGLVSERVTAFTVREGQTVEVEDPRIRGTQTVRFTDGRIEVELRYQLKERNPLASFFIRRAFTDALRRTLSRFARELRGDLELTR